MLRQFAEHTRREGYADGSIIQEAVEEFLYGRHLKASTIRREEIVLREMAEHARQFGWQAWAHRRAPGRLDGRPRSPRMARPRLPITPSGYVAGTGLRGTPPAETPLPAT